MLSVTAALSVCVYVRERVCVRACVFDCENRVQGSELWPGGRSAAAAAAAGKHGHIWSPYDPDAATASPFIFLCFWKERLTGRSPLNLTHVCASLGFFLGGGGPGEIREMRILGKSIKYD